MKQCTKCLNSYPESAFYRKDRTRLRSECAMCYNLYRAGWREKLPPERKRKKKKPRTWREYELRRIGSKRHRLAKALREK